MLRAENVSISYERSILEDLSFAVDEGEVVGIVGANGGGKSSLLRVLSGFQDANEGTLSWKGKPILGPAYNLVPGHPDIQLVNQDFHLDLFHTVHENVLHGMLYLPNDIRESFSEELLELVELKHLEKEQARSLSGGEKQRLAIARALASEPDVLLLDEPFSHLDAHLKLRIGTYLQELARLRKMLVILVSHEGREVMEWCEKVLFLNNKKIERTAKPEEFYYQPVSVYEAQFFGEINVGKIDADEVLFRPTEYRKNKTLGTKVQLIATQFCGVYYRNVVKVNAKTSWVLYSSKPFSEISYIQVTKKRR